MINFIAGVFFGSFVTFISIFLASRYEVPKFMEKAPEVFLGKAIIIPQEEAQNIAEIEEAKENDKEMTFNDMQL